MGIDSDAEEIKSDVDMLVHLVSKQNELLGQIVADLNEIKSALLNIQLAQSDDV